MPEFIDLFCGAGGLSLGLEAAGLRCAAAVEIDKDACSTFAASHRSARIFDTSIEKIDFRQFQGIDLLAGGPPCQPFSSGGKGLADQDVRDMIPEYLRAVRQARPRVFLMENVPGLASPSHSAYFDAAIDRFQKLGYRTSIQLVNAAEYGVPQRRKRLVVVGVRSGPDFVFPQPSHGPRGTRPFVASGKVLSALRSAGEPNESKVTYAKRPDLRPSPYDGHLFNGGGRAIDLSGPCHTILASAGGNKTHFVDVEGEVPRYHRHLMNGGQARAGSLSSGRRLSVPEFAAIQTFPRSFVFAGARSLQYRQIGNAVPPLLAKVIGQSLVEYLA